MNSLRNKLIAAVTMLAVATVMLTSASFAWYTVSTQGKVSQVKVQMQAHDNIEIAVSEEQPKEIKVGDSGDQQTWGSTAVYGEKDADTAVKLTQLATWKNATLSTAVYGDDNRIKELSVAVVKTPASYDKAVASPAIFADNKQNACAAKYDFWIRTNNKNTITVKNTGTFTGKGMTIVITDAESETTPLATWTTSGQSFTLNPTSQLKKVDDSYIKHLNMYVYAEGEGTNASDLETGEILPGYTGQIDVTQANVTKE